MKNLFNLAAVAAALTFATSISMAANKIAYVDPNYLVQNHPLFTDPNAEFVLALQASRAKISEEEQKLAEVEKVLTEELQKYQDEEKKFSDALQKKINALEKEAPRLRSADIKKRQDAINAEAQAFQKKFEGLQQREQAFRADVEAFRQRVAEADRQLAEQRAKIHDTVVVPEIRKVIAEIAKAKGFNLVLDSAVVLHTDTQDNEITQEIFKALAKPEAK